MNQHSTPDLVEPNMKGSSSGKSTEEDKIVIVVDDEASEETPLIRMEECRICQEEDSIKNLESPCACIGSLKYAHRKCVQHWCNEKGDIICEICHQPYQPDYTASPQRTSDETPFNFGGAWQIHRSPLNLNDPRLVAISDGEHLFEPDYDDYNDSNSNGAAFFRSAALILMALLLLRHALSITDGGDGEGQEDVTTFVSLFMLRAVSFLLPCYIMMWAISVLQRRRQRQEAASLAAAQFAFVVQSAQSRGLLVTPSSEVAPQLDRV